MALFGRSEPTMVTAEQALPGRAEPVVVTDRHVVLGTSLTGPWPGVHEVVHLAMGCFWGAERIFWEMPGVHVTAVGYMGGWTPNPTYEETCTGLTGHTETVRVVYDPSRIGLDELLGAFWENHDPTTPNRQGNDVGTQYRSAVFTTSSEQHTAVLASRDRYQGALHETGHGDISTQIALGEDAGDGTFYLAEDYHQGYLHKNPRGYCNHGFCQVAYRAQGTH